MWHLSDIYRHSLHCAAKPVVAGFSPRSLSSNRTFCPQDGTVVYLHPTNASRHQRKSLFSYPVRFGLSLVIDPRVRVHRDMSGCECKPDGAQPSMKGDEKWRFRRRPSFSWFYGTPISTIGVPLHHPNSLRNSSDALPNCFDALPNSFHALRICSVECGFRS